MEKIEERDWVVLENRGQKMFGIIHRPLNSDRCPGIFLCHGFAGNKCGRHRIYVNLAKALSQYGIATFRMDFRGSGDSEGELSEMTLEGEVDDALIGLNYLQSLPFIDPNGIGILGRSLGGAIAVMAATRYPEVKSLALWAPVFHAEQWKEEWKRAETKMFNNIPLDQAIRFDGQITNKEFVLQIFAMELEKHLALIENLPLLHIHGESDTMVKIEHAERYQECRKKSKGISRFLRLPHGDHDFALLEVQRRAIHETCEWFNETLKGDSKPPLQL